MEESWKERFDRQYEPLGEDEYNSSWKFGAPSPLSLKAFIQEEIALVVRGERAKIRKCMFQIQEYPQKVFHLYGGKLPWVIFDGKADEKEKMAIYEAAFRDFTGLLNKFLDTPTEGE